ncbi:hypothetical protein I79_019793 [Cricetulus griseus]|uniref:Uncharacterized protein n=1 Tax=Cricetulus griseus TaxID=10029 RepID=G3I8C9_CRIGR|nr:hypothetical protein I79_019793 [Cricetulus griseus]
MGYLAFSPRNIIFSTQGLESPTLPYKAFFLISGQSQNCLELTHSFTKCNLQNHIHESLS